MSKLLIVADESILAGCAKSGVAEVADSLANAMTPDYSVSVVCPDGGGLFVRLAGNATPYADGVRLVQLFGVAYYLVDRAHFPAGVPALVDALEPDVLHCFALPELLASLDRRPARCIYTIDQADFVRGHESALRTWDAVTTVSETYAEELLSSRDELAATLAEIDFRGITNGILSPVFAPEKGLLVPARYSADDLAGKALCKQRMCRTYGIPEERAVYLMACRLVRDKGLDDVLAAVHTIRDSGGMLLMVGTGDAGYERRFAALTRADGVIWLNRWPSPMQLIPLLAGADYYLNPSISEPCGLMPMTACRYGAVPVVTLAGGLHDNMDESIAVIVGEGGMRAAIREATALYADAEAMAKKRRTCMREDFSWSTRKAGYLEVYAE